MATKKAEDVEQELDGWDLFEKLPKQVGSFIYKEGTGVVGKILNICSYVNEEQHTRLDITYTDETFDFVPVKTIGMHSFREEKYYSRDRDKFTTMILNNLQDILNELDRDISHKMNWEASVLGFDKWDYWKSLPQKIGGYKLYVTPENPINYINGACIFLEYVDFEKGNDLYFSYNYYRNEIYADLVKENLPLTTSAFDVGNSIDDNRKLEVLTGILKEKLIVTLEELSNK